MTKDIERLLKELEGMRENELDCVMYTKPGIKCGEYLRAIDDVIKLVKKS